MVMCRTVDMETQTIVVIYRSGVFQLYQTQADHNPKHSQSQAIIYRAVNQSLIRISDRQNRVQILNTQRSSHSQRYTRTQK